MIRRLEQKDAPYMLEWMRDKTISCNFQRSFETMTLQDVAAFIEKSFDDANRHFAVVDAQDEYMGTISLKNISYKDKDAEYAIAMRKRAQGTGAAGRATEELLQYALEELGLHKVYLNVLADNVRACRFYEKCGFTCDPDRKDMAEVRGQYKERVWYSRLLEG